MVRFEGTCRKCHAPNVQLFYTTLICAECAWERFVTAQQADGVLSDAEKWRRFAVAWYAWKHIAKSDAQIRVRDIGASWR